MLCFEVHDNETLLLILDKNMYFYLVYCLVYESTPRNA